MAKTPAELANERWLRDLEEIEKKREAANTIAGGQSWLERGIAPARKPTVIPAIAPKPDFPINMPNIDLGFVRDLIQESVAKYDNAFPQKAEDTGSVVKTGIEPSVRTTERDRLNNVVDEFKKEIEDIKLGDMAQKEAGKDIRNADKAYLEKTMSDIKKKTEDSYLGSIGSLFKNVGETIFEGGKSIFDVGKKAINSIEEGVTGNFNPEYHTPKEWLEYYNQKVREGKIDPKDNPNVSFTADIVAKIEDIERAAKRMENNIHTAIKEHSLKLDTPKEINGIPVTGDNNNLSMGIGIAETSFPVIDKTPKFATKEEEARYTIANDYEYLKNNNGFEPQVVRQTAYSFINGLMPWFDEGDSRDAQIAKRYLEDIKDGYLYKEAINNPKMAEMVTEMMKLSHISEKEKEDFLMSSKGQVMTGVANMLGMLPYFMAGGEITAALKNPILSLINPESRLLASRVKDIGKLYNGIAKAYDFVRPGLTFATADLPKNFSHAIKNKENKAFGGLLKDFVEHEMSGFGNGMLFHFAGVPSAALQRKGISLLSDINGKSLLDTHKMLFQSLTENMSTSNLLKRGIIKGADMTTHALTGITAGMMMGLSEQETINQAIMFGILSLAPSAYIRNKIQLTQSFGYLRDTINAYTATLEPFRAGFRTELQRTDLELGRVKKKGRKSNELKTYEVGTYEYTDKLSNASKELERFSGKIENMEDLFDIARRVREFRSPVEEAMKFLNDYVLPMREKARGQIASREESLKIIKEKKLGGGLPSEPKTSSDIVEKIETTDIEKSEVLDVSERPKSLSEKKELAAGIVDLETREKAKEIVNQEEIVLDLSEQQPPREVVSEYDPAIDMGRQETKRVNTSLGVINIRENGRMFYNNGKEIVDPKQIDKINNEVNKPKETTEISKPTEMVLKEPEPVITPDSEAIPNYIENTYKGPLAGRSGDSELSPVKQRKVERGGKIYNSILGAYLSEIYPERANETVSRQSLYTKKDLGEKGRDPVSLQSATELDAYLYSAKISELGGKPDSYEVMKSILSELYEKDPVFRDAANNMKQNTLLGTKGESYWNENYPKAILEVRTEALRKAEAEAKMQERQQMDKAREEIAAQSVDRVLNDIKENDPRAKENEAQAQQSFKPSNAYEDYGDKSNPDRLREQITYTHMRPFLIPELRVGAVELYNTIQKSIEIRGYDKAKEDFVNANLTYFKNLKNYNPEDMETALYAKRKYETMFYNWSKFIKTPVAVGMYRLEIVPNKSGNPTKKVTSTASIFNGEVPGGLTFRNDLVPKSVAHDIATHLSRFGPVMQTAKIEYQPIAFDHYELMMVDPVTPDNLEMTRARLGAKDPSFSVRFSRHTGFNEEGNPTSEYVKIVNPDDVKVGMETMDVKKGSISSHIRHLKDHSYGDFNILDSHAQMLKSGLFVWSVDDKNQPIAFRLKGIEKLLNNEYGLLFQSGFQVAKGKVNSDGTETPPVVKLNIGGIRRIGEFVRIYNDIFKRDNGTIWDELVTIRTGGWEKELTVREFFNNFLLNGDYTKDYTASKAMADQRALELQGIFDAMLAERLSKGGQTGKGLNPIEEANSLMGQIAGIGEKLLLKMLWMSEAAKVSTMFLGGKTSIKPDGKPKPYADFIKEVSKFVESADGLAIQKRMSGANKTDPTSDMDRAANILNREYRNGVTYFSRGADNKDYIHLVVMDEGILRKPERLEEMKKKFDIMSKDPHVGRYVEEKYEQFVENFIDSDGNWNYDGAGMLVTPALNTLAKITGQTGKGKSLKVFSSMLGERSDENIILKLAMHGQQENSYLGAQIKKADGSFSCAGVVSSKSAKVLGAKYVGKKWDCISPITEENVIKVPVEELRLLFDTKLHDEAPGPNHNVNGVMSEATYPELAAVYDKVRPKTVDPKIRRIDLWTDVIGRMADKEVTELQKVRQMVKDDPAKFVDTLTELYEKEIGEDPYFASMIDRAKRMPNLINTHEYVEILNDALRTYIKRIGQGRSQGSPAVFVPYDKHTAMLGTYILGVERYLLSAGEKKDVSKKAEYIGSKLFETYGFDQKTGKMKPGEINEGIDFQSLIKDITSNLRVGKTIKFKELMNVIREMVKEGYDANGDFKEGYIASGSGMFDIHDKLYEDPRVFLMTIPGETALNFSSERIISKLIGDTHATSVMGRRKIVQGNLGKDFDIDKGYIMLNSDVFGGHFDNLWEWESAAAKGKYELLKDARERDLGNMMKKSIETYKNMKDEEGKPLYTPQEAERIGRREGSIQSAAYTAKAYSTTIDKKAIEANANPYMGSSLFWEKTIENFQTKDIGLITNIRKEVNNAAMANLSVNMPIIDPDFMAINKEIKNLEKNSFSFAYNPENESIKEYNKQEPASKTNSIDAKQGNPGTKRISKGRAIGNLLMTKTNEEISNEGPLGINSQEYMAQSVLNDVFLELFSYQNRIRRGKDKFEIPMDAFGLLKEVERYKVHKQRVLDVIGGKSSTIAGMNTKQWLANVVRSSIKKFLKVDEIGQLMYGEMFEKKKQDYRIKILNKVTELYTDAIWGKAKMDMDKSPAMVIMNAFEKINTEVFDENLAKGVRNSAYQKITSTREMQRQLSTEDATKAQLLALAGSNAGGAWVTLPNGKKQVVRLIDMFDPVLFPEVESPKIKEGRLKLFDSLVDEMFREGLPGFSEQMMTTLELQNAITESRGGKRKIDKSDQRITAGAYVLQVLQKKWGTNITSAINTYKAKLNNLIEDTPDGRKRIIILPAVNNISAIEYKSFMDKENYAKLTSERNTYKIIIEKVATPKFKGSPVVVKAEVMDPLSFFNKDNPDGYKFWFNSSPNGRRRVDILESVSKAWIDSERKTKILTDYINGGWEGNAPDQANIKGVSAALISESSGLGGYNKFSKVNTIGPAVVSTLPAKDNLAEAFFEHMNHSLTNLIKETGGEGSNVTTPLMAAIPVAGSLSPALTGVLTVAGGIYAKAKHSASKYSTKAERKSILAKLGGEITTKEYIDKLRNLSTEERMRYVDNLVSKYEDATKGDLTTLHHIIGEALNSKLSVTEMLDLETSISHFLSSYNSEVKRAKQTFGNNVGIMLRNFITPMAFVKYYGNQNMVDRASNEFISTEIYNPFMPKSEQPANKQKDTIYNNIVDMIVSNRISGKNAMVFSSPASHTFFTAMLATQNLQSYKEVVNKLISFSEEGIYKDVDISRLMTKIIELQQRGMRVDGNRISFNDWASSDFELIPSEILKSDKRYIPFTGANIKSISSGMLEKLDARLTYAAKALEREGLDLSGPETPEKVAELAVTKKAILLSYINKAINKGMILQAGNIVNAIENKYSKLGLEYSAEEAGYIQKKIATSLWEIDNNAYLPIEFSSKKHKHQYYTQITMDHLNRIPQMYKRIYALEKMAGDPSNMEQINAAGIESAVLRKEIINMYGFFTNGTYGKYTPQQLDAMTVRQVGEIFERSFMGRWGLVNKVMMEVEKGNFSSIQDKIDQFVANKVENIGMVDILDPGYASFGLTGPGNIMNIGVGMKEEGQIKSEIDNNIFGILKDPKMFSNHSEKLYNSLNRTIVNQIAAFGTRHMDRNNEHAVAKEQTMKYLRNLSGSTYMYTKEQDITKFKPGDYIKFDVNQELRSLIHIKGPVPTLVTDESGAAIHQRLPLDIDIFTGVVKSVDDGRITFVRSVNDLNNSAAYTYVLETNKLRRKYSALKPDTDDALRIVLGKMAMTFSKSSNYPGIDNLQAQNGALVQGVSKTMHLAKTSLSTMLLGSLNMPNYLLNNLINLGYGSLYGPQAGVKYFELLRPFSRTSQSAQQESIDKAIGSSSLLSFFSDQIEGKSPHFTNAVNAAKRIFVGAKSSDIEKSGRLSGPRAVIEMFAEMLKGAQRIAMAGNLVTGAESMQRHAIGQERGAFTLGGSEVSEHLVNIAALNAIWMYTGIYSAEGRPNVTTTIAGQVGNLFLPWRSARLSRWFAVNERIFTQAIDEQIGQIFKDNPALKKKGSSMGYRFWDAKGESIKYDNVWAKSKKRFLAETAANMTLQLTTSLLVGGMAYSLLAMAAGHEDAEDIQKRMLMMNGPWGIIGKIGEIGTKANIPRLVGDPSLSMPGALIGIFDAMARIDNKKNKNYWGQQNRGQSKMDPGDRWYSVDKRTTSKLEKKAEKAEGESKYDINYNIDSEILSAFKAGVTEYTSGVGYGMLGEVAADFIGIGLTHFVGNEPEDVKRWVRSRLMGQVVDDITSPFMGPFGSRVEKKMEMKRGETGAMDIFERIFQPTRLQPFAKGNSSIQKKMIDKSRGPYKTKVKKTNLKNRIQEAREE